MSRKNDQYIFPFFFFAVPHKREFWVNLFELGWLEELEDHETFSLFFRPEATLILKQRSGSCSVSIHWHFSRQSLLNKNRHCYLSETLFWFFFLPLCLSPPSHPAHLFLLHFSQSLFFFVIPLFALSDSLFDFPSEMWESQRNPRTQRY